MRALGDWCNGAGVHPCNGPVQPVQAAEIRHFYPCSDPVQPVQLLWITCPLLLFYREYMPCIGRNPPFLPVHQPVYRSAT